MSRYEIHIPDGADTRVERVHGDNWLDALRRGLAAAGLPAPTRNLGVAFGADGAVDINDADAGRTYRVVPAPETTARPASAAPVPAPIEDAFDDPFADDDEDISGLPIRPPVQASVPTEPTRRKKRLSAMAWGPYRRQTRRAPDAPAAPASLDPGEDADPNESVELIEADSGAPRRRQPTIPPAVPADPLLHDMRALETFDGTVHDAAAYLLDRALAHVPSAAGSVLLVDPRDRALYFAAARGPKADALVAQRLPLDVGLAGHCLRTRRSLNVHEPARDPRFARTIADKIGHLPRAIVCLPVIAGRKSFGVLELLDPTERETYSTDEEASLRRAARTLGALIARSFGI